MWYDNPDLIKELTSSKDFLVGFDAGDNIRSEAVLNSDQRSNNLNELNIYRIDGKFSCNIKMTIVIGKG